MNTLGKNLFIRQMKLTTMFLILITFLSYPFIPTYAMTIAQGLGSQSGAEQSEQASSETNAEDNSAEIGLSEAIQFDSFIEKWQSKFNQLAQSLGLGDSIGSQLLMTVIISIITLILLFVMKKLVNLVKNKLQFAAKKIHMSYSKLEILYSALYWLVAAIVLLIGLMSVGLTWGLNVDKFITNDLVTSIFTQLLTVYILVLVAAVILEISTGLVELAFHRWGAGNSARTDTLLPIAKNTVFIVLVILFTLVGLSEMGIDVMPLLAGAGVIGFAVGFAAQAFIKDLLMGFIVILEDLIQVGDIVKVAEKNGVVERITIRKIQLRDLSGSVFTVPFSEVSIVENLTKEFSYALFEIGIAYRENVDAVIELLKQVGNDMCEDEDFKNEILEPVEIFGLDKFGSSAVVIKGRFKTKPIKQWMISREFNRRVKAIFDEHSIEIPFPHQTVYFGEDKKGNAPPLRLAKTNKDGSVTSDKPQEKTKTSKTSMPNENEDDD